MPNKMSNVKITQIRDKETSWTHERYVAVGRGECYFLLNRKLGRDVYLSGAAIRNALGRRLDAANEAVLDKLWAIHAWDSMYSPVKDRAHMYGVADDNIGDPGKSPFGNYVPTAAAAS